MTKQEIINGNVLIAKFMKYEELEGTYYKDKNWCRHNNEPYDELPIHYPKFHIKTDFTIAEDYDQMSDFTFSYESLKFHKNWNWLMPVIEKIEKLVYNVKMHSSPTLSGKWYVYSISFYNYIGTIEESIVEIQSDYTNNESRLFTYYRAVVEFIKWYNSQKQ